MDSESAIRAEKTQHQPKTDSEENEIQIETELKKATSNGDTTDCLNDSQVPVLLNSKVAEAKTTEPNSKFEIKTTDEELVAILEGKDVLEPSNAENIHLVKVDSSDLKLSKNNDNNTISIISREEEREIARQQISQIAAEVNILKKSTKIAKNDSKSKKSKSEDLINELHQDWSDGEKDTTTLIVIPTEAAMKQPMEKKSVKNKSESTIPKVSESFPERSAGRRIIKKKIIWDPDAPETTFSYASLISKSPGTLQVKTQKKTPASGAVNTKLISSPNSKQNVKSLAKAQTVHGKQVGNLRPKIDNASLEKIELRESKAEKSGAKESKTEKLIIKETDNEKLKPVVASATTEKTSTTLSRSLKAKVAKNQKTKAAKSIDDNPILGKKRKFSQTDNKNMIETNSMVGIDFGDEVPGKLQKNENLGEEFADKTKKSMVSKDAIATTRKRSANAKNLPKIPKATDATWDFIYNKQQQHNDDAMIARRRSNSSSSTTSPRRLSLEQPTVTKNTNAKTAPSTPRQSKRKQDFEFVKPITKKASLTTIEKSIDSIAADIKKTSTRKSSKIDNENLANTAIESKKTITRKSSRTPTPESSSPIAIEKGKQHASVLNIKKSNEIHSNTDDIVVKKNIDEKLVQIILNYKTSNNKFNIQIMKKIIEQLEILKNDKECNVVTIQAAKGQQFCQGLDLSTVFGEKNTNLQQRKIAAHELTNSLRTFLYTLATFPKILMAGINGQVLNLGVMILPLFDAVISGDNCTLQTTYTKLGYLPEGLCILSEINVPQSFKTKLLYLNEVIKTNDAVGFGVVTKVVHTSKIEDEILSVAKKLSSSSQLSITSIKQQQNQSLLKISKKLDDEQKIMVQQWITLELSDNLK